MSERKTRAFETSLALDASPEEVWRALTEAEELTRWFPLEARVVPGVGGSVWMSWGGAWEGEEARIEIWEPPVRQRTVTEQARPYDAEGRPVGAGARPLPLAIDYHLEGGGGRTVLRLVHSGFGAGSDWDDEFEGVSRGWPFELRSLRHYLARHRGQPRRVAWARATTGEPVTRAWERLAAAGGLLAEGRLEPAAEGERLRLRLATGDALSGTALLAIPGHALALRVEEFDDGLLRISADRAAGRSFVHVWLSAWGTDPARVEAFAERSQRLLGRLFAAG